MNRSEKTDEKYNKDNLHLVCSTLLKEIYHVCCVTVMKYSQQFKEIGFVIDLTDFQSKDCRS